MSSGWPTRPTACCAWSRRDSFGVRRRVGACQASVVIQPGLMLLTRTCDPLLIANAWVNATSPPFAVTLNFPLCGLISATMVGGAMYQASTVS